MHTSWIRHILTCVGCLTIVGAALSGCMQSRQTNRHVIGISQCSEDVWREQQNREMEQEAVFYPDVELRFRSAADNSERQIEDIQTLVDEGVDLLIISPNEVDRLTPVVEEVTKQGIPVILIERKVATDQYTTFIGADNYAIGRDAATYIARMLNGQGSIIEIRGLRGSTSDSERHRGFIDRIAEEPGLKILAEEFADWHQDKAAAVMRQYIDTGGLMPDVVFAMNDRMAQGVYDVVSGFSGHRPAILGIDALSGPGNGIEAVGAGRFAASFIYPTGGDQIIDVAVKILNGDSVSRNYTLPTAVVDRNNARVIAMQTDQIALHQQKLERMNRLLDRSLARYADQQSLLIATAVILLLIFLLFVAALTAYRFKSKANRQLAAQNDAIRQQAEELASQKTQLEKLSQELEEATQAKLVFFTNISHELKTPLTLISGPIESLQNAPNLTPAQNELLDMVNTNSRRLKRLIDQIIEFRRYENGKMSLQRTIGDLDLFLRELLAPFHDYATRREITLNYETDGSDFSFAFDTAKIEHIVYNLLSNAFKFTPRHGTVSVTLRKITQDNEQLVELTVYDNGQIIPESQLAHIFERFFKGDTGQVGSGIGLALTRALVELHGGTIRATSSETAGTSFIVTLPFIHTSGAPCVSSNTIPSIQTEPQTNYQNPSSPQLTGTNTPHDTDKATVNTLHQNNEPCTTSLSLSEEETAEREKLTQTKAQTIELPATVQPNDKTTTDTDELFADGSNEKRPTVLVIEDNDEIRQYMALILGNEYRVIQATDGDSGLTKAMRQIPDIVISDVMMPGRNGFELCKTLKENLSTNHIPVILLTACALDEQRAQGFESGADAYISKPFDAHILQIRIRKLIEGREKLRRSFGDRLIQNTQDVSASPEQAFIDRVRQYIEQHLSDSELSVDEMGRQMGLSRTQLYRKIKAITDLSPNELVRKIRLRHAQRLLSTGGMTISEVAYETGFSSPSYFTKCFREQYGESPQDYIHRVRPL